MGINILSAKDPVKKARLRCQKKFLYYFKKGFTDPTYISWERQYKLDAHFKFQQELNKVAYERLLLAAKNTAKSPTLRFVLKAAPIFYFLLKKWPFAMR